MSDTSKRIQLGSNTFFQVGTETVIPNDGKAYAMIRSNKHKQATQFVEIEDGQQAAYVGAKPIDVNGHEIDLMIDNQLLTISPDGKLTINLDEIGGELTDKLNIDLTNISEAGKTAIIKLISEAPETFKDTITIKNKILTESGRTIAMSSPDTNVVTYGDNDAYLYFTSKQDLIHMKNGETVHIVDSENFPEYTENITSALAELTASTEALDAEMTTKADVSAGMTGTAVNVATLATNAELATVVQKINELIATLENRGVTKAIVP